MSIHFKVWGDYALFTRIEFKAERVSYDVITPSAARGICDAIYWHPGFIWVIDKITVCKPIAFTNIRRNELSVKINKEKVKKVMDSGKGELSIAASNFINPRSSMLLKNVCYVIDAHFEICRDAPESLTADKIQGIMTERLAKGRCHHPPCLGCREFPAYFAPCEENMPCPEELKGERDLGVMLYDLDFSDPKNITPLFFRAKLRNGVMTIPKRDSGEVIR